MIVGWYMEKHLKIWDSSSEAEHKELAKCAKGEKYIQILLQELNLAELPALLFEDNVKVIFIMGNKQVSKGITHVDLKHHSIR